MIGNRPRYNAGQIVPQFSATCGKCKLVRVEPVMYEKEIAVTKSDAREGLREIGWTRSRAWGWICRTCDRGIEPTRPTVELPAPIEHQAYCLLGKVERGELKSLVRPNCTCGADGREFENC